MKKFSKRILSLLLAVLMVVTSIPMIAITAFADSDGVRTSGNAHLVGQYLTDETFAGVTKNGGVSWNTSYKAAYFNGSDSYVTIDGAPLSAVTSASGFTITFSAIISQDGLAGWARLLDFNAGTCSGDNDSYSYLFLNAGGNAHLRLCYNNPSSNPGNKSETYAAPSGTYYNAWHNFVISGNNQGTTLYIDGNVAATIEAGPTNTFINNISQITNYCIGKSAWGSGDGYFKGYIKDFKLYDASVDKAAGAAITLYEDKMNGTIYQNDAGINGLNQDAYDKYNEVIRAHDAYFYGANTDANTTTQLETLAGELVTATNKLTPWIYQGFSNIANKTAKWYKSGSGAAWQDAPSDLFNGLLYAEGINYDCAKDETNSKTYVRFIPCTMLYDGVNTPTSPVGVVIAGNGSSTKARNVQAIVVSDSYSNLSNTAGWRFKADNGNNWDFIWCWNNKSGNSVNNYIDPNNTNNNTIIKTINLKGNSTLFMNAFQFTGTNGQAFGQNEYYRVIKPTITAYVCSNDVGNKTPYTDQVMTCVSSTASIVVLNYKAVLVAMSDNSTKFIAKNYKPGSLTDNDVFLTYDDGIYFSLKTYFDGISAGTQANNYTGCATEIGNVVSALNDLSPETYNHPQLRAVMTENAVLAQSGDMIANARDIYASNNAAGFTNATWTAFKNAYEAGIDAMDHVADDGKDYDSLSPSIISNIDTTFKALKLSNLVMPTVTASTIYIDSADDSVTITKNSDASVKYQITYYNPDRYSDTGYVVFDTTSPVSTSNATTTLTDIFNNGYSVCTYAKITAWSYEGADSSAVASIDVYNVAAAPTFNLQDRDVIDDNDQLIINPTAYPVPDGYSVRTLYSYDYAEKVQEGQAPTWNTYSGSIIPFTETGETVLTVYAKYVLYDGSNSVVSQSDVATITLVRSASFTAYSIKGADVSSDYYYPEGYLYIEDTTNYDANIKYIVSYYNEDGAVTESDVFTYTNDHKGNGVKISTLSRNFADAKKITITAYSAVYDNGEGGYTTDAQVATFNLINFNFKEAERDKYLFAYFTSNTDETLHYAVSDDGLNWEALNGNRYVFEDLNASHVSDDPCYPLQSSPCYTRDRDNYARPASGHIRDPYAFEAEDGTYYIVATDLDSKNGSDWGNNTKLHVWHLQSFEDISKIYSGNFDTNDGEFGHWYVETANLLGNIYNKVDTSKGGLVRSWAPEAVWDAQEGAYMIYFAMGAFNSSDLVPGWNASGKNGILKDTYMFYLYTNDFQEFYSSKDAQGNITECTPQLLIKDSYTNGDVIDGSIIYSNGKYYLWYKDQVEDKIGYIESNRCNQYDYSKRKLFTDKDYNSMFEGPEVYQLYSDGSYIMMADNLTNPNAFFGVYNSATPYGFEKKAVNANINHLFPRHGSVVSITSQEYKNLVNYYGKSTFDATDILDESKTPNDYLVARYFTTDDLTYDAVTGRSGALTVRSGVTAVDGVSSDVKGRAGAKFDGSNSAYAYVNTATAEKFSDINIKDGVTLTWYGYDINDNNTGRWFDWSSGGLSQYNWGNDEQNLSFAFCDVDCGFGVGSRQYHASVVESYQDSFTGGHWHQYTMTLTDGYIHFFVDGKRLKSVYEINNYIKVVAKQGTPYRVNNFDNTELNRIVNGYLKFGLSTFQDNYLNGVISDFRVYSKALIPSEISQSELLLATPGVVGTDIFDEAVLNQNGTVKGFNPDGSFDFASWYSLTDYYDPMENMNSVATKTSYGSKSVAHPTLGTVLDITGGVESHNGSTNGSQVYAGGADASKGYTIGFWYNPGTINKTAINGQSDYAETIFNIGKDDTSPSMYDQWNNGTRQYFELFEDGRFRYVYDTAPQGDNYIDIDNCFGPDGLEENTWVYIAIQVVPSGTYDKIYFYVEDKMTQSADFYSQAGAKRADFPLRDYLSATNSLGLSVARKVAYGKSGKPLDFVYNSTSGQMDEFTIYNNVYTPESIKAASQYRFAFEMFQYSLDEYLAKMAQCADGVIFTNLKEAYDAYDACCRYKDAIEKVTSDPTQYAYQLDQIVELANRLHTAVNNMEVYTAPVAREGLDYADTGVDTPVDPRYTHNLLSPVNLANTRETDIIDDHGMIEVSSTSFVWLYTGIPGDTPTAPVNGGGYQVKDKTNISYYYLQSIYLNSAVQVNQKNEVKNDSGLALSGYWHFPGRTIAYKKSTGYTNDWVYDTYSSYNASPVDVLNYRASAVDKNHFVSLEYDQSWNTRIEMWEYGSNVLNYNGSLTVNDGYLVTVQPAFHGQLGYVYTIGGYKLYGNSCVLPDTGEIKIINYLPVQAALTNEAILDKLAHIDRYSPASAAELLSAYDTLTNQSYIINSTTQAEKLATTLKAEVDNLLGIDLDELIEKADDSVLLEAVQEQMPFHDAVEATMDENGIVDALELNGSSYVQIQIENADGELIPVNYTTSSWASYDHAYDQLTEYFVNLNPFTADVGGDQPYATEQEQLDTITNNVNKALQSLQYAADYTKSEEVVEDGSATQVAKSTNNVGVDGQIYTYDTFLPFGKAYVEAEKWADKSDSYKADTEMYSVGYISEFDRDGIHFSTGPYIAYDINGNVVTSDSQQIDGYKFVGEFYDKYDDAFPSQFETGDYCKIDFDGDGIVETYKLNGHRYYVDSSTLSGQRAYSVRQQSIIDAGDSTASTYNNLKYVDAPAAYDTFDAAMSVISAYDNNKYTTAGITAINNTVNNSTSAVYFTLNDDQADEYSSITGGAYSAGDKLKLTGVNETDYVTSNALSDYTVINDDSNKETYIKKYTAKFIIQDADGAVIVDEVSQSKYYGEMFDILGVDDENAGNGIRWSVTTYDDGFNNATGSTKFGYNKIIKRVADNNIYVTATIGKTAETGIPVFVKNVYDRIIQVVYVNDISSAISAIEALNLDTTVPFYTFAGWSEPAINDDNASYTVRATYTRANKCNIIVNDGSVSSTYTGVTINGNTAVANYDDKVTIKYTGSDNFKAWAVINGGDYQIASYKSTYTFYVAPISEEFFPVIENGGKYYINGKEVTTTDDATKSKVELDSQVTGVPSDKLLNDKLDQELPFVSIITVDRTNIPGKARAYVRTTYGDNAPEAYGVKFDKTGGDAYNKQINGITNVLPNGQFSVTIGSANATIIATITYNYEYTAVREDLDSDVSSATISVVDYSKMV